MQLFANRQSAVPDDIGGGSPHILAAAFAAIRRDCRRLGAMAHTAAVQRLDRLIAAEAWVDAALALIAIELPRWTMRRLAYDDGEWHCALSDHREMPDWLDTPVETHNPDMATVLLDAVREALRAEPSSHLAIVPNTSAAGHDLEAPGFEPVLCDNFA